MRFFGNRTCEFLDPPVECRMIQIDTAFGHDFFEVTI
jgi:hypothetical protein